VQKFWKSIKIWQSYRQLKSGNFLRHGVYLYSRCCLFVLPASLQNPVVCKINLHRLRLCGANFQTSKSSVFCSLMLSSKAVAYCWVHLMTNNNTKQQAAAAVDDIFTSHVIELVDSLGLNGSHSFMWSCMHAWRANYWNESSLNIVNLRRKISQPHAIEAHD